MLTTHSCGKSWTGLATAHCSACHETFATVRVFDAHRTQYGNRASCQEPGKVRMNKRKLRSLDGIWHAPEMLTPVLRKKAA